MNYDENSIVTEALGVIVNHYGMQKTARSGVPLINHIIEGLIIMNKIGSSEEAQAAWCLHPMMQSDADLMANYYVVSNLVDTETMMYVMEYRNCANAYLMPDMHSRTLPSIPMHQVRQMLVADKIQNRKDFMLHHKGTHPHSDDLEKYFDEWCKHLGLTDQRRDELTKLISEDLNEREEHNV